MAEVQQPKFNLTLRIVDLNNIPLGVGTIHVKWQLPSSSAAETRDSTEKAPIQEHRASWDYEKVLVVRMVIDKKQVLEETELALDVFQEFSPDSRADREYLGNVKLNLAEYVGQGDNTEGVMRRYLLQDSKINATLNVGILVRQIEGETNFETPPLKPATVFSGIAGFMSMEQSAREEPGSVPSFNSGSEIMERYDYYRSAWAATYALREDEPTPEEMIEDIWAGGDGFCGRRPYLDDDEEDKDSDADSQRTARTSGKKGRKKELDELEVREDLRSWTISSPRSPARENP